MSDASDRLLNSARVRLPGAVDDALKYELFAVLDEFFTETDVWRETVTMGVTSTRQTYEVEPDTFNARIVRLISITYNGATIAGSLLSPNELTLHSLPGGSYSYSVTFSVTVGDPVISSTKLPEVPDWILSKYFYGLLDGLLYKMMSQPAKPYTNQSLSVFHYRRFINIKSVARRDAQTGYLQGGQNWRFPQFG